jgi:hypothetical protein
MSDEVLQIVDPLVLHHDDPVARFATGTRLYMRMAVRYPLWGAFITQVGTRIATRGQMIDLYLTRDLELARKRLNIDSVRVARDIVLGAIFYGIETMLTEPTLENHPEQILRCVLVGLGLKPAEAEAIAFLPLEIPGEVEGPIFSGLKSSEAAPRRAARSRPGAHARARHPKE